MVITRRAAVRSLLAAPAILGAHRSHAATRRLRISHQFPGGTAAEGDFRDRLVRHFAAAVQTRTGGGLQFDIHPESSLFKSSEQFPALCTGALDLSTLALATNAGGTIPEANIGLMPCLVTTYEQGIAWKDQPVGRELAGILETRGVKIVTWIWVAGSTASRTVPIVEPDQLRGVRIRGGSHEMDLMLKAGGGILSSVASNEIYAAMQAGRLDAAVTSSTSIMSFRLHEVSHAVTVGGTGSFWFMFYPLLMSKQVFDALPAEHQRAIVEVGAEMEPFAIEASKADDQDLLREFASNGGVARDMDENAMDKWRTLAEGTAWRDFAARDASCARLLKLAQAV